MRAILKIFNKVSANKRLFYGEVKDISFWFSEIANGATSWWGGGSISSIPVEAE